MRKAKALNGAPNDLVQMFFSTEAYFRDGCMADHLWAAAMRSGQKVARIDVLHMRIDPEAFSTPALLRYLPTLKQHLLAESQRLQLPDDHITSARIDVFLSEEKSSNIVFAEQPAERLVTATGSLALKDGKMIVGKTYTLHGVI